MVQVRPRTFSGSGRVKIGVGPGLNSRNTLRFHFSRLRPRPAGEPGLRRGYDIWNQGCQPLRLLCCAVEHTVSVVDSQAEQYNATRVTGQLRSHDFRLSNGTVLTLWQVSVIRASWLVLDVEVSGSYRLYTAAPEARRTHAALSTGADSGVW